LKQDMYNHYHHQ